MIVLNRLSLFAGAILLVVLTVSAGAADLNGPRIDRVWARATPGSARTGAAYFTIVSPVEDRLVGLTSPVARKAELHTHVEQDGIMQMRAVEGGLTIPANQPVELKPGDRLHVMLIDLTQKLEAGDRFPLILTFEKAGVREVAVKVQPLGAMGPPKDDEVKHNVTYAAAAVSAERADASNHSSRRTGR